MKKNDKQPEDYTPNSNQSVWWKCSKCGHEWPTSPNHRNKKDEKGNGCPKCNESKGEKRISKCLTIKNLYYSIQYKFKECKNKKRLPFDFALFNDKEKTKIMDVN